MIYCEIALPFGRNKQDKVELQMKNCIHFNPICKQKEKNRNKKTIKKYIQVSTPVLTYCFQNSKTSIYCPSLLA